MSPTSSPLILGTRGSDLALAQSALFRGAIESAHFGLLINQKIITTTGDARTMMPLHEPTAEGAGLFTKQLQEALLRKEIDVAVHSLKDLPVETPPGLTLAAILPRASTADLLVSRHHGGVAGLPVGAVVGSSSPRRMLLLSRHRPDLKLVPIRGNVPTRLAKIVQGEAFDATILAAAGLVRLGHDVSKGSLQLAGATLLLESLEWMLPAPGQGAIAVEARHGDRAEELVSILHDPMTARCVEAERLVLRYLGGGCQMALGALATESHEGISLKAVFIPSAVTSLRSASASARSPSRVARLVADQLLSA